MSTLLQESFTSLILQPFSITYFLLFAIFLTFIYKWSSASTKSSLPPSPWKLPIIGNIHQLGFQIHLSLQTLAQRHGPLMLIHFGSTPVLVVSSAEGAREIMKTHDVIFANRPKTAFFKKVLYNCQDVGSAPYGEYWRQMKSICVLNLLSTKRVRSFRAVREEETKSMINTIMKQSSTSSASNLSEMFLNLSNDVVCRVALGRKYSGDGEDGRMFRELSADFGELAGSVHIGDYIPWLSWVCRLNGLDAKFDDLAKRFNQFLELVVKQHREDVHVKNEDQKDLVDVLLSLQREEGLAFPIDDVSIKAIILDMFVGGTDTTSTSLEWIMSELLRHPRVMNKLQNEIRGKVANKTEILTEEDLVDMHYMRAVIKETLRLHPPAPLLFPRISTQDVKINGYNIKANTQVIVNSWPIGRDPKSYDKPEEFNPERFLIDNAIDYKGINDFQLIPFGGGRRLCPGVQFTMAVQEIFLANLLHKFNWALPGGARGQDLDMSESFGSVVHRKYPLIVVAIPYSCG